MRFLLLCDKRPHAWCPEIAHTVAHASVDLKSWLAGLASLLWFSKGKKPRSPGAVFLSGDFRLGFQAHSDFALNSVPFRCRPSPNLLPSCCCCSLLQRRLPPPHGDGVPLTLGISPVIGQKTFCAFRVHVIRLGPGGSPS